MTGRRARLDRITPKAQDETRAVTHYRPDNDALGDRSDWTRALPSGRT
jgi:hypothetical protein